MSSFDLTPFSGIFVPAMTFFDREGNLDEPATANHWRWLLDQGIDGLVVAGTSGEFISLSIDERLRLFRLAVDVAGGRVPIVAGTGHAATKWTVEMSQQAQELGVDAFIVTLPYYSLPPLESVLEHYRTLRRNTDRPIMLYNNPGFTACKALTPRQVAELVEDDVLHMIKSTMESVIPIHELAYLVGDRMRIFYGSFMAAYEGLAAGAHGWISGLLNVAPVVAGELYRALAIEKDMQKGFALWRRLLPLVHLYTHGQLGTAQDLPIYRGILRLWGLEGGHSRPPMLPLNDEQIKLLEEKLAESGWLEVPSPFGRGLG